MKYNKSVKLISFAGTIPRMRLHDFRTHFIVPYRGVICHRQVR